MKHGNNVEEHTTNSREIVQNDDIKGDILSLDNNRLSWVERYQDIASILAFILNTDWGRAKQSVDVLKYSFKFRRFSGLKTVFLPAKLPV